MRKFLLPIVFLLTIISCGKKRVFLSEGNTSIGILDVHYQTYFENDTFYKRFTDNEKLVALITAKSESEFNDSTFTRKVFSVGSILYCIEHYKHGKKDGDWLTFYDSGNKKTSSSFSNGIQGNYETWYESGKPQITGKLLSDSTFSHREYFENGFPKKEMASDKTGKGHCTTFHLNGKTRETGPIVNFNPCGIWKIYDTLGKLKHDTVFGIK